MKRILVIRMSSIGDIVLGTSFLSSVKNQFPDAKIDFLIKKEFAPILSKHPQINRLICYEKAKGFKGLINLIIELRSKKYDSVFDIHNVFRSRLIGLFLRNVKRIQKPRWKRLLLFYFKKNLFSSSFSHIEMYHTLLPNIMEFPLTNLHLEQSDLDAAKSILDQYNIHKPFIALVPGAAWEQKQWPKEKYNTLIDNLNKNKSFNFVILGGPNDTICDEIESKKSLINLKGKTSLLEAMSLLKLAQFTIGSDTGLVHISEALGTPVGMILGPTSRETGAGVNHANSFNFQVDNLSCRPCSQNGKRKCYQSKQFCMENLEPQLIAKTVLSQL